MNCDDWRDRPLETPDDDLLAMGEYAKQLTATIKQVTPPLTIGVYGEWGSGKTSFVNFVRHHLGQEVPFIEFSAWPYRTADELWRALLVTIARRLYDVEGDAPPPAPPPAVSGLFPSLVDFLSREAIVLRESAPTPDDKAEFRDLMAKIDDTFPTGIAKGPASGATLNPNEVVVAIVQTGFKTLEQVSPLVAMLRGFLGWKPDADLTGQARGRKAEATERRLKSIRDFHQAFRDLFERRANRKRICVFIDDLDRCMPDASLDLLEAIRVFLGDIPAVFIVAADEQLIGQGLRLRFRDLVSQPGDDGAETFLAAKGKEYFEKVIQIPVRVPPHSVEQSYNLIAAHFPAWRPASDILRAAAGDNPRRLKQYGHLLGYRHAVWSIQERGERIPVQLKDWLSKLIELQAWCPHCLEAIRRLHVSARNRMKDELVLVEEHLTKSADDKRKRRQEPPSPRGTVARPQMPVPSALLTSDAARNLLELLDANPQSRRRALADPLLSSALSESLEVLAAVADLRTDEQGMLTVPDSPFMRVLQSLFAGKRLIVWELLMEDYTRLIALDRSFPNVLTHLTALADSGQWNIQVQDLEAYVWQFAQAGSPPNDAPPLEGAANQVYEAFVEVRMQDAAVDQAKLLQDLLLGPVGLAVPISTILPLEILAFAPLRGKLPAPETLLPKAFTVESEEQKQRILANHVLEQKLLERQQWERIERGLRLRIQLAEHMVGMRTFAKLDSLEQRWPALAQWQRLDRAAFLAFENAYLQPSGEAGDVGPARGAKKRLDRYRDDDELARFLNLRPYFKDINRGEVAKYSKVAQAAVAAQVASPPAGVRPPAGTAAAPTSQAALPQTRPTTTKRPSLAKKHPSARVKGLHARVAYEPIEITITKIDENEDFSSYQVTLIVSDREQPATTVATLQWKQFEETLRGLDFGHRLDASSGTRNLRAPDPMAKPGVTLQRLGTELYDTFFDGPIRNELARFIKGRRPFRLFLKLKDPKLQTLPWETLYLTPYRLFVALTREYSVVRAGFSEESRPPLPFDLPLRLIVIMPEPKDLSPLNGIQELEAVKQALEGYMDREVLIQVLQGARACREELQRSLRVFAPQLFHFIGHGHYDQSTGRGQLIFQEADIAVPMPSDSLADLLVNSNVQIAFLNGCDTGKGSHNDSLSSVSGALVDKGLPAVVATTREVNDSAALRFSREFYRTLADGYNVEGAMAEARLALNVDGWNWSSYALYSGWKDGLDALRLASGPIHQRVS